jgi:DNA-binding GntR family transcriptional regulator
VPGVTPTPLQRRLALQIVDYIREKELQRGAHLTELALSANLRVSRTPVRAALKYLATVGAVGWNGPRGGFLVKATAAALGKLGRGGSRPDDETLYVKVAEDYVSKHLPEQFSEADMMRRYSVSRGLLMRVLQRMTRDGVIERNPGHGWRFAALLRSSQGNDESYRFRMAVEPAALLDSGFVLDRTWAARCLRDHENILSKPNRVSILRFFEVNADFHASLARCSGNPFFHQAVQQQNQLRRFLEYSWTLKPDRIEDSCREHLAILSALEQGDQRAAATLMRRHLQGAMRLEPAAARGASPGKRT